MEELEIIEKYVQEELDDPTLHYNCDVKGGIVNKAALFTSDQTHNKYFIKFNNNEVAKEMFDAESSSLEFLRKTQIIDVPKSFKVMNIKHEESGNIKNCALHILEYIPDLQPVTSYWSELGEKIGRLHSFNSSLKASSDKSEGFVHNNTEFTYVDKFGSLIPRYLGTFRIDPSQRDTWEEYLIGDVLNPLFCGIEKKYGDRELMSKWSWLQLHISKLFQDVEITPEVTHGDLCLANFGQTENGPVLFDPCINYAHSEFDLLLSYHEDSFDEDFFTAYHKVVPQPAGFEKRMEAYNLFYNIIMWYHIDDDKYREGAHNSADTIKNIIDSTIDS